MKTTKTIILTACIALAMVFTSCSKDDDSPSIVGVWLQTAGTSETIKNGTSEGVEVDVVDANNYSKFTFNADGSFSEISSDGSEISEDSGTYTTAGNTLSIKYTGEIETYNTTFVLTDKQLIVNSTDEETYNGDTYIYKDMITFSRQ